MEYDIVNASVRGEKHEKKGILNMDTIITNRLKNIYAISSKIDDNNHKSDNIVDGLVCKNLEYKLGILKNELDESKEINILQSIGDVISNLNKIVFQATDYNRLNDIEGILETVINSPGKLDKNKKDLINQARKKINNSSINYMIDEGISRCTLDVCFIHENMVYSGHVGNGRTYKINADGTINKMTKDHLKWNSKIDKQYLSESEKTLINKIINVPLDSYIGIGKNIKIDLYEFSLEKGDSILMCNDGLTQTVSEEEMAYAVYDIDKAVFNLLDIAEQPKKMAKTYSRINKVSYKQAQEYLGLRNDTSFIVIKKE
ncbi:hypothetical protein H8D83_01770 [Candidatus Woesearchaeota archaeon]|nr:hypothetical protein [Candidatus Woesearchaeota archaeon]